MTMATAIDKLDTAIEAVLNQYKVPITLLTLFIFAPLHSSLKTQQNQYQ